MQSAIQVSAVYACVRVIAETIASLPLHIYKTTETGSEKATEHSLYRILHDEPNREMTSFVMRETMLTHLLLWGNSYSQVIRTGRNQIDSLYPLLPDHMEVDRDSKGKLTYTYTTGEGKIYRLAAEEVLHIPGLGFDGVVGYSPIALEKNAIGLGLAAEEYGSKFFSNGARPSGILTHPNTVKEPKRLRDSWNAAYGGSVNSGRVKVFDLREDRAAFGAFATNTKELYVPADWKLMVGTASAFTTADTIPIANGGTGATTAAAARTALGVPATAHTHVKANITDFPTSMPASDVYAWAKASTKPTYTNTEVGAAAEGHTHSYLPLAGGTLTGKVTVPTATRSAGLYGVYDSTLIGHIWSMGSSYAIPNTGADFGTLYGMAYKHTNNTTGGTMAGGHQIVFCSNGTPGAAIGLAGNIWTSGTVTAAAFSGPLTGSVTGNVTGSCSGSSGSCTGNAATATKASNSNTLGGLPLGNATQGSHPGRQWLHQLRMDQHCQRDRVWYAYPHLLLPGRLPALLRAF